MTKLTISIPKTITTQEEKTIDLPAYFKHEDKFWRIESEDAATQILVYNGLHYIFNAHKDEIKEIIAKAVPATEQDYLEALLRIKAVVEEKIQQVQKEEIINQP